MQTDKTATSRWQSALHGRLRRGDAEARGFVETHFVAAAVMAAPMLVALCGCSSTQMPSFLPTFGKSKSKQSAAELANAPAPPGTYSATETGPSVSMPPGGTWSNLPVYPGTNYPQTPYPEHAMAQAPPYASQAAAPAAPAASPQANPYAPPYGAMPPSVADNSAPPYAPYAASAGQAGPYAPGSVTPYAGGQAQQTAPSYAPPAGSYAQQTAPYAEQSAQYGQQAAPYAQPQTAPYAQQQTSPYGEQQTPPYAGQQAPPYAQQQAPPSGGQADPYGATPDPYTANPYGTYTR
jgi:hypothetical protein